MGSSNNRGAICAEAQLEILRSIRTEQTSIESRRITFQMLILIIILVLLLGGGGGYYGYGRWGAGGGAGIGLGTILVILLTAYLLGFFR